MRSTQEADMWDPGVHMSVASKKGKKGVNSLPRGIELGSAGVEQGSVTSWAALRIMSEDRSNTS